MEALSFEIKAELDKMNRGLAKASASIEKFSKNNEARLKKFAESSKRIGKNLSVGLSLPILGLGAASIKAASDFEETEAKFKTVFSNISASAEQSANELRNSFGLSSKASRQLLSDTGDLLTGFGFNQKSALDLSTEVNKLAVDLASFTNFSGGAEGASQALTKALLGERESVKSLGISILEADVKAKMLEQTQEGLTFETERQAKAFATLTLAQEQSKNAIGDYARTNKSFANQMRLLKARASDLSVEFGKVLLPFATKLAERVGKLVNKFTALDDSTKKIIVVVAGLAAAVGPLLLALGGIVSILPAILTGLSALGGLFATLTGPIGLAVAGVAALSFGLYKLIRAQRESNQVQSVTNRVRKKALKSISEEKAKVEELLYIAKDEKVSKENRLKAIRKLNAISPKYLGNLDLETINTDKAKKAVEKYSKALERNATVKAAQKMLQEIEEKRLKREIELSLGRKKIQEEQNDLLTKNSDNVNAFKSQQNQLTKAKELSVLVQEKQNKEYQKEKDLLLEIIATNKDATSSINQLNKARSNSGKPQQQAVSSLSPVGVQQGEGNIDGDLFQRENIKKNLNGITEEMLMFNEDMNSLINGTMASTFSNLGTNIGNALANGKSVVGAIGQSLTQSFGRFLSDMGDLLIEYGLFAKAKGALDTAIATGGPVAIAAGAAAVAVGVALKAAGAAIGNRAQGGFSGGTGAGASSAPQTQNFNQTASQSNNVLRLVARGEDLVSVIDRVRASDNLIGG